MELSSRKARLISAACCRKYASCSVEYAILLYAAEQFADSLISRNSLEEIKKKYAKTNGTDLDRAFFWLVNKHRNNYEHSCLHYLRIYGQSKFDQQEIINDIANPITKTFALSTSVQSKGLADEIYKENSPQLLPILIDSLQDDNAPDDIINHLKRREIHYKGCWAIDLILGKK